VRLLEVVPPRVHQSIACRAHVDGEAGGQATPRPLLKCCLVTTGDCVPESRVAAARNSCAAPSIASARPTDSWTWAFSRSSPVRPRGTWRRASSVSVSMPARAIPVATTLCGDRRGHAPAVHRAARANAATDWSAPAVDGGRCDVRARRLSDRPSWLPVAHAGHIPGVDDRGTRRSEEPPYSAGVPSGFGRASLPSGLEMASSTGSRAAAAERPAPVTRYRRPPARCAAAGTAVPATIVSRRYKISSTPASGRLSA